MNDPRARRSALRHRICEVQAELARLDADYGALSRGEQLPGLHLVLQVAGQHALVAGTRVEEVVWMVALTPPPGELAHVAGTFVHRGRLVAAVDLAGCFGRAHRPRVDSRLVVCTGVPRVALIVDEVAPASAAPLLLEEADREAEDIGPGGSRLVAAVCRCGDDLLPLLELQAVRDLARGLPAACTVGDSTQRGPHVA